MARQIGWKYETRWGTAMIVRRHGSFVVLFDGENLGSYGDNAMGALEDLVGGHTSRPSCGKDPEEMRIPDSFDDWEPLFG